MLRFRLNEVLQVGDGSRYDWVIIRNEETPFTLHSLQHE